MSAYGELTEYIGKHKDVINDVAKKLDNNESVAAEDVMIYAAFKQLSVLAEAEAEERSEIAAERLRIERERCEQELEQSQQAFDALVARSLELFENVK